LVCCQTVSLCCDQYHDLSQAESEYHEVLAFHPQHNYTPSPQVPKGSLHLDWNIVSTLNGHTWLLHYTYLPAASYSVANPSHQKGSQPHIMVDVEFWYIHKNGNICKFLGFCSNTVEVSVLLGCSTTSHGDRCLSVSSSKVSTPKNQTYWPLQMRPLRCVEISGTNHKWHGATTHKKGDLNGSIVHLIEPL